jgi:hypothetical protein
MSIPEQLSEAEVTKCLKEMAWNFSEDLTWTCEDESRPFNEVINFECLTLVHQALKTHTAFRMIMLSKFEYKDGLLQEFLDLVAPMMYVAGPHQGEESDYVVKVLNYLTPRFKSIVALALTLPMGGERTKVDYDTAVRSLNQQGVSI